MPRINLRDQEPEFTQEPIENEPVQTPPPPYAEQPSRRNTLYIALGTIVALIVAVFLLNQFHVIHLWGKKPQRVVVNGGEMTSTPAENPSPSAQQAPPAETTSPQPAAQTPLPTEPAKQQKTHAGHVQATPHVAAPSAPPSGATGAYAVQVSAWPSKDKADAVVAGLSGKGYDAYVVDAAVNGKTWYRVRVGKYGSAQEAAQTVVKLQHDGVANPIVVH